MMMSAIEDDDDFEEDDEEDEEEEKEKQFVREGGGKNVQEDYLYVYSLLCPLPPAPLLSLGGVLQLSPHCESCWVCFHAAV